MFERYNIMSAGVFLKTIVASRKAATKRYLGAGVESRHGAENSALKNIAPFNRTPLRTSEDASIFLRTPSKVSWRLRKAF